MWSARDVMMLVRAAWHAALNARLSDGSPVRRYRVDRCSDGGQFSNTSFQSNERVMYEQVLN